LYDEFERIVILGGPRCGKSSLAARLKDKPVFHTDDLILSDLASSGAAVSQWFSNKGPWIVEGVTVTHALWSWLAVSRAKPCDCVLALWRPLVRLTSDQRRFLGVLKEEWSGLTPELMRRGVVVRSVTLAS